MMIMKLDGTKDNTGAKLATAFYVSLDKGLVINKVRIPVHNKSDDEEESSTILDQDTHFNKFLDKDNNYVSVTVYNALFLDSLTLNILSAFTKDTKLCIYTTDNFFKAYDIGEKTGKITFDLVDESTLVYDETVSCKCTPEGFMTVETENGYRPIFRNSNTYEDPTLLIFKIVGNENATGASIIDAWLGGLEIS